MNTRMAYLFLAAFIYDSYCNFGLCDFYVIKCARLMIRLLCKVQMAWGCEFPFASFIGALVSDRSPIRLLISLALLFSFDTEYQLKVNNNTPVLSGSQKKHQIITHRPLFFPPISNIRQ